MLVDSLTTSGLTIIKQDVFTLKHKIKEFQINSYRFMHYSVSVVLTDEKTHQRNTPASNLGYLAPPPGQFFMGAKLFIGTPWMGNEGVLKKILVWAM